MLTKGVCLKFYVCEMQKHRGILLYDWLLECARKMGLSGGSAFRAIGGFGHHGVMHEEHFFELASNVPVEIHFFASEAEAEALLARIKEEKLQLFSCLIPVQYGFA